MSTIQNIEAVKSRMKDVWNSGDYGRFATYMEPGAVEILNEWKITPGEKMLDVACGAGQISIPASRAGVRVTGVDIAPNWIAAARARAAGEGLDARFDEGDAELLPYADGAFDVVATLVGAMFAPRPEMVASELVRVTRPGGRILMVNWTPEGFVGQMFQTIGKHLPPPSDVASPLLWGNEEVVKIRFGNAVSHIILTKKIYPLWHYPFGVPEVVQFFFENYGPTNRAAQALDGEKRGALRKDLEQVFSEFNIAKDGTTTLFGEYLEVDAVK
ncbi:MAG: methyltransferase domain-containing protein [Candidatus Dadabacteria bacterium]|nr:methyltransferase domain-containing protein [Candidatus Dadabacteria bacterium]